MEKKSWLKFFSPAWFAAVMGTGGIANVLYFWSNTWFLLRILAVILAWLNFIMFLLLLFPWLIRWFTHFSQLKKDLDHPVMGNFFVTMPVGAMIVASNAALMGGGFLPKSLVLGISLLAWLIGIIGAYVFGLYVYFNMLRSEQTMPQAMNLAWLITPVASIAVPLIGSPLVNMLKEINPGGAKTVLLLNLSFYGIGFFLFIFIGAIIFNRLAQYSLPPAAAAPTFWITLGPIGVGAITLMTMADSGKALGLLNSVDTAYLLAAVFWGLGFWALGIAIFVTWRYLKQGPIPFSLTWWAFIFPLAAYTMASFKIAGYFNSSFIYWYTGLLTLLLAFLWLLTFFRTLGGTFTGKLFQPQPQPLPQSAKPMA